MFDHISVNDNYFDVDNVAPESNLISSTGCKVFKNLNMNHSSR